MDPSPQQADKSQSAPAERVEAAGRPMQAIAAPAAPWRTGKVLGVLGSLLLHACLWLLISRVAARPAPPPPPKLVELAVIEQKPEPPPPPPPAEPEEKKPEPPKVAKVLKPRPKSPEPPPAPKDAPPPPPDLPAPEQELPPPPNDAPAADARPKAPVMIGVSLSSTTTAGTFAAPVGNTLYGNAPRVAPRPEDVKSYATPSGRYVPPYKVTRLPEVAREVKANYPEEARKLGLEAQVKLELTIDATGKVIKARVLKRVGNGFDEAALEAVRHFAFKPGTEGGEPVVTEITYTYTFVLD